MAKEYVLFEFNALSFIVTFIIIVTIFVYY